MAQSVARSPDAYGVTGDQALVLVRGCSGSGKRSLAKRWLKHCKRVEADTVAYGGQQHFEKPAGDSLMFRRAVRWSLEATTAFLEAGDSVAVCITLLSESSLLPWLQLAEQRRVRFAVIECHGEFKNQHGLPAHYIAQQREDFEPAESLASVGVPVLCGEEVADAELLAKAPVPLPLNWMSALARSRA